MDATLVETISHDIPQSSTEEAAIDIAAFVAIFFDHFSQLRGRAFHLAGESYGGRYLPVFAAAVHDLNPRLAAAGYEPVNLESVLIGMFYHTRRLIWSSWY
jgi:carboxypeptidase C (cathepsin A)